MYKTAVRQRSPEEQMHDISSRMNELVTGHGDRHPIPEIELLQNITTVGALPLNNSTVPSQILPEIELNSADELSVTEGSDSSNVDVAQQSERLESNAQIV